MRVLPSSHRPSPHDIASLLRSPLLRRLFAAGGEATYGATEVREYDTEEVLCGLEAPPEGMWLVLDGEASLTRRLVDPDVPATEVRSAGSVFGFDGVMAGSDLLARAETPLLTLFLPVGLVERAADASDGVRQAMAFYAEMNARRGDIVRGLRRAVCFRDLSPRRLLAMLELLDRRGFEREEEALKQGAAPSGVFVVLSGQLEAWRSDATGHRTQVDVYTPGEVFGDVAMTTGGEEPLTVIASGPSVCGFLPREAYFEMISSSPSLRRRLGPAAVMAALRGGCNDPEAVVLVGPDDAVAGRQGLTRLVASSLADAHQHRPLLFAMTPGANGDARPVQTAPGVHQLQVDDTPEALMAATLKWRGSFDTLFVLPRPSRDLARLAPALGRQFLVAEDVYRRPDTHAMARVPQRACALIGRGGDPRGYPSRTVRLRLTGGQVAALSPDKPTLQGLPPTTEAGIARLGRAITERLVGLALGGGGALGFAHVALIRALASGTSPVPIDLIGGASFGALVSAFYAAEGLAGLDKLVEKGGSAWPYTQASMISSRAFQWWVDGLLDGRRMEDLDIPMVAVATDVAYGVEYVPRKGTVGSAVRASGAMPPLFTPVLVGGSRIVDGGFINNVPASVLRNEGASFVIASNVVATQLGESRRPAGRAARFMAAANPFARARDLVRSSLVLFHAAGARESLTADASFATSFVGMKFWDFGIGTEMVRATEDDPRFPQALERIRERWAAFTVDVPEVS